MIMHSFILLLEKNLHFLSNIIISSVIYNIFNFIKDCIIYEYINILYVNINIKYTYINNLYRIGNIIVWVWVVGHPKCKP